MTECEKLRMEVEELRGRVSELEGKEKKTRLADLVEAIPIECVRWGRYPDPYYSKARREAWNLFVALAKEVNSQEYTFEQLQSGPYGDYTNPVISRDKIKKLEEIEPWDMALTAEMIEKMVEIYNEYYRKLHPTVIRKDTFGRVLAHDVWNGDTV